MNLFDFAIILILCFCLIRGIFTGLIRELFSVTGVLIGFYAASTHYIEVAKSLSYWMPGSSKVNLLSFLGIFFGFLIAISIMGKIVKSLFKIDLLKGVDYTVGAGIGIIKGILLVSVLLIALTAFLPKDTSLLKNSLLSPHFNLISEKMVQIVPKAMRYEFLTKIGTYKKAWKNEKWGQNEIGK
jgi:membrane protein required for colicin V production